MHISSQSKANGVNYILSNKQTLNILTKKTTKVSINQSIDQHR